MTEEGKELGSNKVFSSQSQKDNWKYYHRHAEEQRARVRKYRDEHLEQSRQKSRNWRTTNKEHVKEYNLKYRKTNSYLLYRKRYNKRHWHENKELLTRQHREWYVGAKCLWNFERRITFAKSREEMFHILGHVCAMCGQHDKRVLQFDHINGGGTQEHKTDFQNRRAYFYQFYAHNPRLAKEKLQVLCANCNVLKRYQQRSL